MFYDNFVHTTHRLLHQTTLNSFLPHLFLLYKTNFYQRVFEKNLLRYSNLVSVDLKAGHVFKNGIASVLRKAPLQVRVRSKLLRLFR